MQEIDMSNQPTTPQPAPAGDNTGQIAELLMENHKMLKSIRRSMRLRAAMSIVWIIIVIVPIIAAYLYIPPLIREARTTVDSFTDGTGISLPKGFDLNGIQELLER